MKTTFSYFPGMFENKLEAKCYFKKCKGRTMMKGRKDDVRESGMREERRCKGGGGGSENFFL